MTLPKNITETTCNEFANKIGDSFFSLNEVGEYTYWKLVKEGILQKGQLLENAEWIDMYCNNENPSNPVFYAVFGDDSLTSSGKLLYTEVEIDSNLKQRLKQILKQILL
jgi:hypothetical protein